LNQIRDAKARLFYSLYSNQLTDISDQNIGDIGRYRVLKKIEDLSVLQVNFIGGFGLKGAHIY
jgi:hypothetical protein